MNIFKIIRKIYSENFSWAFDGEYQLDRSFNDLDNFHERALPDSENRLESLYCKVFKSNAFTLLSPIVYLFLTYMVAKYSNPEYLNAMLQKSIEGED